VRAANRRAGLIVGLAALAVFIGGLYLIGVAGLRPPEDEFYNMETREYVTRNAFIDQALPRGTEDALEFEATYEHARDALKPYLAATATAIHNRVQDYFVPHSTLEAENFESTANAVSTVVRPQLIATVTAAAGD
jgi:hypothetical protein